MKPREGDFFEETKRAFSIINETAQPLDVTDL
jgi:hypothetical protein